MLFNSLEFLVFLPIVFLLYWFVFTQRKWQNFLIVASSYIFYGWWDWRFLLLITLTALCSYASGIALEHQEGKRMRQKWICIANITLNLLILCIFKYYNFFRENTLCFLKMIGIEADWVTLDVLLPVGISFYTFQALSYTIDVYQKKIKATYDVVAFLAFISFFPQLVAGPIERATNLLPQFLKPRTFKVAEATDGMRQILWGLFKKIVVADNCALIVNSIFNTPSEQDGFYLLMGGIFFSFQIYGDFSGYSDIAIGIAKLFNIHLMRNFNNPYFSRNIGEFWRRWHISLNTWFRDYIYIPLGGSRVCKAKVLRNTLIIFLVSGFWHGANWTFICWGAYHALLFFPLLLMNRNRKFTDVAAMNRYFPNGKEMLQMICTFILAVIGWIIFRAENMEQAYEYIYRMFTCFPYPLEFPLYSKKCLFFIGLMLMVEWSTRYRNHGLDIPITGLFRYRISRWLIYYGLTFIILQWGGKQEDFIYFQF